MVTINIGGGKKFDLDSEREMKNISHDDAEKVVDYIRRTVPYSDESKYLRPISESTTFLSKLSLEKLKCAFHMAKRISNSGDNEVLANLCNQGAALSRFDNNFLKEFKYGYSDIDTGKIEKIISFRTESFDSYVLKNKEKTNEWTSAETRSNNREKSLEKEL